MREACTPSRGPGRGYEANGPWSLCTACPVQWGGASETPGDCQHLPPAQVLKVPQGPKRGRGAFLRPQLDLESPAVLVPWAGRGLLQ